jgi:UDP:flavonoid glycosyltransferase YjiC (YdhE family)
MYNHLFFISPPFYSHFNPLLYFAKGFLKYGCKVTFACSIEFKELILISGMDFYELDISNNKNLGTAESTSQPIEEIKRLEAFFQSTKLGPAETLITQSKHRKADMLYNPEVLIDAITRIDYEMKIDVYVVDVLSYGLTIALHASSKPFITFCPPHPQTIPDKKSVYGVPKNWPSAIRPSAEKLEWIEKRLTETQIMFTDAFNHILSKYKSNPVKISNAFRLVSDIAVVYNYLDFGENQEELNGYPSRIFMGHSFDEKALTTEYLDRVNNPKMKIMISLGTFLSARDDVMEKLIIGCKRVHPEAVLYVSAGKHVEDLRPFLSSDDIIEEFLPQIGLMPYMDLVIHHGGNNTFTEALYYGIPMVILPFSSDQFNIAFDAESNGLAEVLDPNSFNEEDLSKAIVRTQKRSKNQLSHWSKLSRERGVDYAVRIILGISSTA